jgi:hypothetical protein
MSVLSLVRTSPTTSTTSTDARTEAGAPADALVRRTRAAGRSRSRTLAAPRAVARRVASAGGADAGMTTAEYAVGTVGACGFGGVLVTVLTSEPVKNLLVRVIEHAFHFGL